MIHDEQKGPPPAGIRLSPQASFVAGVIGGVLILCTIGFVILLGMVSKGQRPGATASTADTEYAATDPSLAYAPPTDPYPEAPPAPVAGDVKPVSAEDHVRGDMSAAVTLIEYSDFECPFCQRFHPTMMRLLDEYDGQVKWVYRHFPLSFHQNAEKEAEAAECAGDLGGNDKFWAYADAIFDRTTSNGTGIALSQLGVIAEDVGLDRAKFQKCLDSGKFAARVRQDLTEGGAAGITGTPGTVIIGEDGTTQLVPGAVPYEQLKSMVDSAISTSR